MDIEIWIVYINLLDYWVACIDCQLPLYFALVLPVATSPVTITQDPTGTLYVGGNVTLECLIELDNTVDTSVTVAVIWSASNGVAITNTSRYVLSPVTGSFRTHHATLYISNLMTNDSGNYACSATASPDPPSPFIASNERQSKLLSVTIGKKHTSTLSM